MRHCESHPHLRMLTPRYELLRKFKEHTLKALNHKMITASVDSKYQITIPKEVRDALYLRPSDTLIFLIDGDSVYFRPQPESFTGTLRGLHKHLWSDADTWLEGERADWD